MDLIYSFSKSYSRDKQKEFIQILKKLEPYLIFRNQIGVNLNTGVSLRVLPTELIWEILLYLKPSELAKFYKAEKEEYKQIFRNQIFWKQKFYYDFVSPKKYGEDGYVYSKFIERLFEPKNWKERYAYFYKKIKQFNELNSYLLEKKGHYDAGSIIVRLSRIFKWKDFEIVSLWGELGSTYNEMVEKLFSEYYKFWIRYIDKLFLVNIIKIINEQMKILKNLGKTGYYSPHDNESLLIEYILHNFTEKLKNDKDIFLMIIKIHWKYIQYTGEELRRDRDFVLAALNENGNVLKYTPFYKNDTEVVLKAVSNQGMSIQYAGGWLRDNKDIVLAAVKNNPQALQFASDNLKDDEEIIVEAIKRNRGAL
jgi:hypothetical protein